MSWKINEKGGVFEHGAPYPFQKRVQIILTYVNSGSVAETSRVEKVSYNCVSKLVSQFQQTAQFGPRSKNKGRPNSIPTWMKVYIEALIIIYPSLYLHECVRMLAEDFNLAPHQVPSCSAVKQLLKSLHITRKKCIHVARERFTPYVLSCRKQYIRWRLTVDPSRMYFFDETAFTTETDEREYGRIESGFPLPSFRNKSPTLPKYSVIGLCGYNEGLIQAIAIEGNYNTVLVNEVIENQILPLLPRDTFLVCDNASIHNEADLSRILALKNIHLVKLPAYSYDLNPIEMAFGLAKSISRKYPEALQQNMMLGIVNAFLEIDAPTVRKFYRKAWKIFC